MHRRDYEKVAAILRRNTSEGMDAARATLLIGEFADLFAEDNPLFDRDKFFKACLVGPSYVRVVK
jgi:hypothetical protein